MAERTRSKETQARALRTCGRRRSGCEATALGPSISIAARNAEASVPMRLQSRYIWLIYDRHRNEFFGSGSEARDISGLGRLPEWPRSGGRFPSAQAEPRGTGADR